MNIVITAVIIGVLSSVITAKIITARYLKLLSDYTENNLKQTKDLFKWFVSLFQGEEKDKHR